MAFGGVQVNNVTGNLASRGAFVNFLEITGLTLAARAGAFDATGAAADSGLFSTALVAPANTNLIPATFGRGAGNWLAGDQNAIMVTAHDNAAGASAADLSLAAKAVTAGQLTLGLHNDGAGATGATFIQLLFIPTIIQ